MANTKIGRNTFRFRLDQMITTLREDILTGKYVDGDYLPSESSLIEQFKLSKHPVRNALNLLVEEGLIQKIPRVGSRVVGLDDRNVINLKFGYYPSLMNEVNLEMLLQKFHQTYPTIHLQAIPITDRQSTPSVKDMVENGELDVVTINQHNFELFINDHGSVDLLVEQKPLSNVYPFLFKSFTSNGFLYAQPFVFSPIVLCYNRDHLKECHLPEPDSNWTWDYTLEVAKKLAEQKKRFGLLYQLFSANRWPLFLLQNDFQFERNSYGQLSYSKRLFKTCIRTSFDLLANQNSMFAWQDKDIEKFFLEQKASMIITSYFSLNSVRDAAFDYDIAPLPYDNKSRTLLLGIGIAICSKSKQKKAANLFTNYLLSESAQLHIRENTLSIPSVKSIAEWKGEEKQKRPSHYGMFRDIIPTYRQLSDVNISFDELEKIRQELKYYWSGLEDLETACQRIERLIEETVTV
ncbi:extracellular solute-binding protein [Paenibacillus sp. CMAA1364]